MPNYQSENEIIALNRVLHNAMSQVPVGVVVTQTGERRVVVANSEFHRIMGISQGSLINSTLKDAFFDAGGKCFYPDSGVFNEELFVHHLLSRNHYIARGYEVRIHQPGGSQLNVLMHSSPVLDDKKQTIAMVTIVQDITRIKKKEEAQLRKEAHLEYALSATVDGLWDWDIPGDKDFLSSRALVTEKDENGVPVKMVGTHQDITREMDLKQAQKRINQKLAIEVKRQTKNLETTNQQLETILNESSESIWVFDGKGVVITLNRAAEKSIGCKAQEMLGLSYQLLLDQRHINESVTERVLKEKKQISMMQHLTKQHRDLLITGTPVFDDHGQISMVIVNERDLTQLNHLKNELESQRHINRRFQDELTKLNLMELKKQNSGLKIIRGISKHRSR